jgi:glyoxylase-like metal-dependent hydrolase (beta-lactamase superfamily II)/ferredoxin
VARPALRHPANAEGSWYVDERCIDCGTCRDIAPGIFGMAGAQSVVVAQPLATAGAAVGVRPATGQIGAWLAAQACPTQSIGILAEGGRPGRLYPRELGPGTGVFDLGYCAEDSFGASSWLVTRPAGNLLVDSPRWAPALVKAMEDRGGLAHVLLTHRDDVADADRYAAHFGARVWIHADDAGAAPYATDRLTGLDEVTIAPGVVAVPVPGHTRGSVLFVVDGEYLFTGDSLAWSHERQSLMAFRHACWYSWSAQTDSLARFADSGHRFGWVLPGHGARVQRPAEDLHELLADLVGRMGDTVRAARR